MSSSTIFLCLLCFFLPIICAVSSSRIDENDGRLTLEVDKSGEWSDSVVIPSPVFRIGWIDEECCWKSKLTVDLVGQSPPYLAVPFGRMQVGEQVDLRQLWHSTLAAYRAQLEAQMVGAADGKGRQDDMVEGEEEGNNGEETSITKRSASSPPNWLAVSSIRLSANCPTRIHFQQPQ